jgi:glycosyltransferase involved in cell wall biosynthesis
VRCAEWFAGRALSGIVAATPSIARRFPSRKTALVQNFPLKSEFRLVRHPAEKPFAVYTGQINAVCGAVEMVCALQRVRKYPDMRLIMAGAMDPPELMSDLASLPGWERVTYLGWLNRLAVETTLSQASVGLVLYHPIPNAVAAQPNKLFEYMAAGLPVVVSNFPLWRTLVVENGCGLCVPPDDVDAIARAIEWILENPAEAEAMGRRGQALIRDKMNWEHEKKSLLAIYDSLLRSTRTNIEIWP